MQSVKGAILCLAYITGLLLTALSGDSARVPSGAIAILIGGGILALVIPRVWRTGPSLRFWLLTGLIGSLATLNFQIQSPRPSHHDISHLLQTLSGQTVQAQTTVTIQGHVISSPRLTRSKTIQFDLKAESVFALSADPTVDDSSPESTLYSNQVTGRVYTTIPLLQGTGLYPGQLVQVSGILYEPSPAKNPGGFDFQAYLRQRGIFSGLRGDQIDVLPVDGRSPPILWQLRQRIVRSMVRGLGSPDGALVSAMVLGRRAVDLPHDLRDQFNQAGLAHTIAASGFHVSLLLGVVMVLTQRLPNRLRFTVSTGVLLAYIGLTGAQPSVIRAGLMGFGALVGATLERKTKPISSLLLAATLMLIVRPGWIWDLGFQLSFLATLGLLVTAPVLIKRLDWMPTGIAALLAIPIAAYGWTMPLQLYNFGVTPTYSILLNVLATPFIVVISLGGMISGAIALIIPQLGSHLAGLLHIPIRVLVEAIQICNQLPGNSLATGTLSPLQVFAIYGLYAWIGWSSPRRKTLWVTGLVILGLVIVPLGYTQTRLTRVTVLSASDAPAIVVQDRGTAGLIYGGSDADVEFTLLPFLQQQGIHRLQWAIALPTNSQSNELEKGWPRITNAFPIRALYYPALESIATTTSTTAENVAQSFSDKTEPPDLSPVAESWMQQANTSFFPFSGGQQIRISSGHLQFLSTTPPVIRLTVAEQTWLIVCPSSSDTVLNPSLLQGTKIDVLWWSGQGPDANLMKTIAPAIAITPLQKDEQPISVPLSFQGIQFHNLETNGSLQWTPHKGFLAMHPGAWDISLSKLAD